MEVHMTRALIKALAVAASFAGVASLATSPALARGGKEYFAQTYTFKQPMKGVEGREGAFYCSHRTQPIYKTLPNGKRVIVGHELFQHCY